MAGQVCNSIPATDLQKMLYDSIHDLKTKMVERYEGSVDIASAFDGLLTQVYPSVATGFTVEQVLSGLLGPRSSTYETLRWTWSIDEVLQLHDFDKTEWGTIIDATVKHNHQYNNSKYSLHIAIISQLLQVFRDYLATEIEDTFAITIFSGEGDTYSVLVDHTNRTGGTSPYEVSVPFGTSPYEVSVSFIDSDGEERKVTVAELMETYAATKNVDVSVSAITVTEP